MSYVPYLKSFEVGLADLSIAAYTASAVFQLANATGNLTLSIASGVITLPPGRYMLEGYPYVDIATTSDQITFIWQSDAGGPYADIGIEGQIQVEGDTIGERDVALAVVDSAASVNVKLIVRAITSTGTPTDAGGCIVVWRES